MDGEFYGGISFSQTRGRYRAYLQSFQQDPVISRFNQLMHEDDICPILSSDSLEVFKGDSLVGWLLLTARVEVNAGYQQIPVRQFFSALRDYANSRFGRDIRVTDGLHWEREVASCVQTLVFVPSVDSHA